MGHLGTKCALLLLENHDGQAAFLQKLTQFSEVNKLLDAAPSKFDGFLSRDTYIAST
jgi:hypothetical protein